MELYSQNVWWFYIILKIVIIINDAYHKKYASDLSLSNDAYEEIFQEIDTTGLVEKRYYLYLD